MLVYQRVSLNPGDDLRILRFFICSKIFQAWCPWVNLKQLNLEFYILNMVRRCLKRWHLGMGRFTHPFLTVVATWFVGSWFFLLNIPMFAAYLLRPRPLYKSQEMLDPSQVPLFSCENQPMAMHGHGNPQKHPKTIRWPVHYPPKQGETPSFYHGQNGATLRIGVKSW